MSKPMKPAKAWAVVSPSDKLAYNEHNEFHILRRKRDDQRMAKYGFRALRVRILDDAAVERAIAALRTAIDTAEKLYDLASEEAALYKDAIRDLGGRP